jgi:3-isopropylmalate/(R)-2-methylmalate dehydratase large subunit
VRFLKERRGIDVTIEPWMSSDEGVAYVEAIRVGLSSLSPMVAAPGDAGNGIDLSKVPQRVAIDIAYGGSCTVGKREHFDRDHEVLSSAAERGQKVPPHIRLFPQFGTPLSGTIASRTVASMLLRDWD